MVWGVGIPLSYFGSSFIVRPVSLTPHAVQGFSSSTPVAAKSASLRVTTVRRWCNAVAAIRLSIVGIFSGRAMRRPHSSATAISTGRTRSSNQAGSSVSSHAAIRSRRWLGASFVTPLRISPKVRTLTNSTLEGAASNQPATRGDGFGLTSSDNAHVSIRKLTVQYHEAKIGRVRCPTRRPPAEKSVETQPATAWYASGVAGPRATGRRCLFGGQQEAPAATWRVRSRKLVMRTRWSARCVNIYRTSASSERWLALACAFSVSITPSSRFRIVRFPICFSPLCGSKTLALCCHIDNPLAEREDREKSNTLSS